MFATGKLANNLRKTMRSTNQVQSQNKRGIATLPVTIGIAATTVMLSSAYFISNRYKISKTHENISKTGLFVDDIDIDKKTIIWPFQQIRIIDMTIKKYEFDLDAKSIDPIDFVLPCVFMVGPKNDKESLIKYVRYVNENKKEEHDLILGYLAGGVRVLIATLPVEQIFNDKDAFINLITKKLQPELDKLGLEIHGANIKEMFDAPNSNYFKNRIMKKESQTENAAKIDVSEANKMGNIGAKAREAETRQQVAVYEAETIQKENANKQNIAISKSELSIIESQANQKAMIAKIESDTNADIFKYEKEKVVQEKKVESDTVGFKASLLAQKTVEADVIKLMANAKLYEKQQEASGIQAVYDAQAKGINELLKSFGNNRDALMQYLMVEKDQYRIIAETNSKAFQGLKPNITMFNTGGASSSDSNPVSDICKMMLPLGLTYLNKQMGFSEKETTNNALMDVSTQSLSDEEAKYDNSINVDDSINVIETLNKKTESRNE